VTPAPSKNTSIAKTIPLPPAPHNPGTVPTTLPPTTTGPSAGETSAPKPTCPTYDGTNASRATVGSALSAAAATPRSFTYNDSSGVSHTVSITAPDSLLKAIAWQESGWQSQIVACDGGYGTMQIMSATATWMNNRFGTSYDYRTLSGNTQIGSEYVEWLIAYFGEVYYNGDFDTSTNQSLLDDVVSAYNVGPGNVNPTATSSGIINPQYVANVEALAARQPWNS
jgi:soluble lytic murein transglycosylase-like protein